jgi:hypothetical protein
MVIVYKRRDKRRVSWTEAPRGGILILVKIWKLRMVWSLCINKEKRREEMNVSWMSVHRGTKAKWSWGPHTSNRMPMPAYNEFPLQMELPKSMRDLPEFTWGRCCRVVVRSKGGGYRDGNWFSGTKNYTIMYKVDKSWFGFLSRPEIESQIYSHLLCTWWYKSRSGFQSFLWRPAMWIMANRILEFQHGPEFLFIC